jgi:hypothetical protein
LAGRRLRRRVNLGDSVPKFSDLRITPILVRSTDVAGDRAFLLKRQNTFVDENEGNRVYENNISIEALALLVTVSFTVSKEFRDAIVSHIERLSRRASEFV